MRIFTLLGVVFLVIGVGLAAFAMLPGEGGVLDEVRTMGSGIAAITLIPMGLIFTAIGVWFGRLEGNRKKLLREGIPGQATILSISGGNMVVNNINYLIKFHLRVLVPGRPPYEVEHSQLVPIFALASFPVGGTLPVVVDRADPEKLTIDLSGEALAMRQTGPAAAFATPGYARPVPNTLSSMQVAMPNTITGDPDPVQPTWPVGPSTALPSMPSGAADPGAMGATVGMSGVLGAASMAAINDQLQRMGLHLDPSLFTQGAVTVDASTVDASPGPQAALLADGRPGRRSSARRAIRASMCAATPSWS